MPPAICDSEDEDEILLDDGPSQRSTFSAYAAQAEAMLLETFPNYDGAGDEPPASTTSSELRRQILSAERNLAATASLSTPAMATSTSPVLQKDKRRKSTAIASEPVASPPKSVRRTKTTNVKTYGKSNRTFQAAADADAAFNQLRDDVDPVKTSQSAKFTEHSSGPNPSSGLPAGTIHEDFINHEPNLMFKDTGSTNAFNESSQQRLVEQALNNGGQTIVASEQKGASSAERQQSSFFPWSASADATQSPTNKQLEAQPETMRGAQAESLGQVNTADDTIEVATKQTSNRPPTETAAKETDIPPNEPLNKNDQIVNKASQDSGQPPSKSRPPRSSPVVEIPRYQPSQDDDSAQDREESRSRKRKAKDDEEPLNSDDKAIGLLKENYKPRPSRRRATAVLEEPIDYSVIPEKAAKKRRKTADGKTTALDRRPTDEDDTAASQSKAFDTTATSKTNELETFATTDEDVSQQVQPSEPASSKPAPTSQQELQPDSHPEKDAASAKKAADAMLMKPPTVPASASKKIRRSKTTIFEDHVNRTEKSPTLSQQQASRQSALLDVPKKANSDKRKKRRTIVEDDEDDDDEDELAKDMSEKEEEVAPKKRGRPAKQKPQKAKSKERVLKDSDEEEDELELEVEELPKKKPRGRPPKAQADKAAKQKETAEQDNKTSTSDLAAASAQSSPTKSALERKDASARLQSKDSDTTTEDMAPEKPAQTSDENPPTPQETPAKPSHSTTHSPIKGSSFANYRVGLSKRSRIPSLLKSFRAPTPARR